MELCLREELDAREILLLGTVARVGAADIGVATLFDALGPLAFTVFVVLTRVLGLLAGSFLPPLYGNSGS